MLFLPVEITLFFMANIFFSQKPLTETQSLTKPIQAYDPTKSVEQNMAGQGQASAQNIMAAYKTPQAQLQLQTQRQEVATKPQPTIDPNSDTSGMDVISHLYTSTREEDRLRRASVANQRILAIGDALRHIGNIYNTIRYAPAQKFNSPVQEEYDRYQKGKALRDAANIRYMNYQQAKAAQDAKARQWEADYNLKLEDAARKAGYTEAQIKNMQDRLANQKAYQEGSLALRERLGTAQQKERERHNKVAERQGQQRIGIASQNAKNMQEYRRWRMNGGGGNGGGGIAPLDTPKGRITPNGRNYSNQLLQMYDYAKSQGLVKESDVANRLRELGYGKDQSDNVKRQMVMDLLRTNPTMGDYAAERLGWSYGGGSSMDLGLEDDDDEMDLGLE